MTDEERRQLIAALRSDTFTLEMNYQAADELERLAALEQSDAEPIKWLPDANMRAELDRSELVARALLKEIMKQIDCIEAEGNIEWHKRIKLNGELYLPDLAVAVLAVLYTAPLRPDASAGLIEAAEWHEAAMKKTMIPHKIMVHKAAATYFRARAADRSGKS